MTFKPRTGFILVATVAAIMAATGCDQLKNVYCTNVLPALSKPCTQSTPAPEPVKGA